MMNLSLIKDLDILQGYHLLLLDDSFIFSNIFSTTQCIGNVKSISAPFFRRSTSFGITHLSRFLKTFFSFPLFLFNLRLRIILFPSNLTFLTNSSLRPIIYFCLVVLSTKIHILWFKEKYSKIEHPSSFFQLSNFQLRLCQIFVSVIWKMNEVFSYEDKYWHNVRYRIPYLCLVKLANRVKIIFWKSQG